MGTKIEWTRSDDGTAGKTWNIVSGCTRISEGCERCYIERTPPFRMAHRKFDGQHIGATTGVQLHPDRLGKPLHWRKPARIFVCSLADLFHDGVPDQFIAQAWATMALAPQHTFQVLTKRPARMRSLLSRNDFRQMMADVAPLMGDGNGGDSADDWLRANAPWPLRNVWVGVTAENQRWADLRIPQLLTTPAAVRWISAEPLLGPVELRHSHCPTHDFPGGMCTFSCPDRRRLDWVVAGGETGPGARPMHPAWARSLRDQCSDAGVPFFFKQWGDWKPTGFGLGWFRDPERLVGAPVDDNGFRQIMRRVGKKVAGRELDGREWNEYPRVAGAVCPD